MICPICGSYNVHVIDSRATGNKTTHRRYCCDDCGVRFSTEESVSAIKKNGRYEKVENAAYRSGIEDAKEAVRLALLDLTTKKR